MTNNDYILVEAQDKHIPELINLLCLMPDEANTIYPPYNKNIMARYLKTIVDHNLVLILIKNTKIIGAIGGSLTRWWWSDSKMLVNSFLYILEEHRTYDNAKELLNGFNKIATKNLVPVIMGTSDAKDMERKDMLFQKLGFRKIGGQYGVGV